MLCNVMFISLAPWGRPWSNVLEIQENFENYVDKKDTTMGCLEGLKAHAKLLSLGESLDGGANLEGEQVKLIEFNHDEQLFCK